MLMDFGARTNISNFWGQKDKGQDHGGIKYLGGGTIIDGVVMTI